MLAKKACGQRRGIVGDEHIAWLKEVDEPRARRGLQRTMRVEYQEPRAVA